MNYWLFKSEPDTWSWNDQLKAGKKGTPWNGVRNFQARNNMMKMKKGDRGLFYHSGGERNILGVVEVIKEAYPDHTAEDGNWQMVDIAAVKEFQRSVSLAEIKEHPLLENMVLVKQGRLSVSPVTKQEFEVIQDLGT
ncbi:MAG: EVE domain-containing protein [Candidatus Altimarinota bacterium]